MIRQSKAVTHVRKKSKDRKKYNSPMEQELTDLVKEKQTNA